MDRKGQAAMEFLMTYGWAILVVLAAIGALAYFGVLSPDRFLADKCVISGGFSCGQYKVTASSVQFEVQNNLGVDASGVVVTLYGKLGNTTCMENSSSLALSNGAGSGLITYACPVSGTKFRGDVNIVYTKSGETVSHNASGSITAKVE